MSLFRQGDLYHLAARKSPAYANFCHYLSQRGWRKTRFASRARLREENFDFHPLAMRQLEEKHLLTDLLQQAALPFMPQSLTLDWQNWPQKLALLAGDSYQGPWILKPALLNNGQGIRIFRDPAGVERFFTSTECMQGPYVLQRYIDPPHLLQGPERGHKYSLRFFMFLSTHQGSGFYEHGYANIALTPYEHDNYETLDSHLTNEHLSTAQSNVIQRPIAQFPLLHPFIPTIKDQAQAVIKALQAAYPEAFAVQQDAKLALLGIDFMLGQDERVYLLEVNHGPCFPVDSRHPLYDIVYRPFWTSLINRLFYPPKDDPQDGWHLF